LQYFINIIIKLKIPKAGWEFFDKMSECHFVQRDFAPIISLVNWLVQNKTDFSAFGNFSLVKKECYDHKSCSIFVIDLLNTRRHPVIITLAKCSRLYMFLSDELRNNSLNRPPSDFIWLPNLQLNKGK
jgi:hypothetical protein